MFELVFKWLCPMEKCNLLFTFEVLKYLYQTIQSFITKIFSLNQYVEGSSLVIYKVSRFRSGFSGRE
ncbi:hypothetical protein L1887_27486 [Cichorium endivia]|nr:hypothetical protein L1887_27486 [Cichorium endivia]